MEHLLTVTFPPFSPPVRVSDSCCAVFDNLLTLYSVSVEHRCGVTRPDSAADGFVEFGLLHEASLVELEYTAI